MLLMTCGKGTHGQAVGNVRCSLCRELGGDLSGALHGLSDQDVGRRIVRCIEDGANYAATSFAVVAGLGLLRPTAARSNLLVL